MIWGVYMKYSIDAIREILMYIDNNEEIELLYISYIDSKAEVWEKILPDSDADIIQRYFDYLDNNGFFEHTSDDYTIARVSYDIGRRAIDIIEEDGNWQLIKEFGNKHKINDFCRLIERYEAYSLSTKQKDQLNACLDMILSALGANAQLQHADNTKTNELISELEGLLKRGDEGHIKAWLSNHGVEGVATLASVLQLFIK